MNILTFDIEEWFHLLDNDATCNTARWDSYEVRIHDNMERIFDILGQTRTAATFFIIGWVAKKYPQLVRRIAEKYQTGSHTMMHQPVWQQNRNRFRRDVADSIALLEDITGQKVECFRAPGFSIRESEAWAFEVLAELGIKYDCSVFPAHHAHGGMPAIRKAEPCIIRHGNAEIKEFPVNAKRIAGQNIIYSGGGYFRLLPYGLIRRWTARSNGYMLSYIHPRDMDAGQPVIRELPLSRRFKSYVGLRGAEKKLRQMLADFRFTDIRTADSQVEWDSAPVITL